jgi:ABC-type polysaccharide/polyol phosphate export permease
VVFADNMTRSEPTEPTTEAPVEPPPGAPGGPATAPTSDPDRRGLVAEFREMVHELVHYRELLWQMVLRDVRIRYKQAVMGFGWALLMPLVIVAAGSLVKYAMARLSGDPMNTADFAGMTVKALGWSFFVGAVGFSTNSLVGNMNLVTKIYFPREVFPVSAVVTQTLDSSIGSALLAVFLFAVLGIGFSVQLVWVVPLVALLILLTAGAALLLSCANVFFRDVKYLVQVILTFGIFFTPVFYEPHFFGPTGSTLMMLNPLAPIFEGLRLAVVEHHNLLAPLPVTPPGGVEMIAWHPWYLGYAAAWSVLGFLGAWLVFHRLEFVYPEYI